MAHTGNISVSREVQSGIVSIQVMDITILISNFILQPPLIVLGLIGNALNMIIFYNIGLKEVTSACFFIIATSDLIVFFLALGIFAAAVMLRTPAASNSTFDPFVLMTLCAWYGKFFLDFSDILSAFVAFTRCCCVARPLTFKSTFTPVRTYLSMSCIGLFLFISYVPVYLSMGTQVVFDSNTNATRIVLWYADYRLRVVKFTNLLNRLILPFATFIIMIISALVLADALRSTSYFRTSLSGSDASGKPTGNDHKSSSSSSTSLSGKELQVVKVVTLVTVTSILCHLPFITITCGRLIVPDFNIGKKYSNFFTVASLISTVFIYLNLSVSCIIYYNFNSKYRHLLQSLVRSIVLYK